MSDSYTCMHGISIHAYCASCGIYGLDDIDLLEDLNFTRQYEPEYDPAPPEPVCGCGTGAEVAARYHSDYCDLKKAVN